MGIKKETKIAKVGDQYICNADGLDKFGMVYTISELSTDSVTVIFEDGSTTKWCYKRGRTLEWYDDLIPTELIKALL